MDNFYRGGNYRQRSFFSYFFVGLIGAVIGGFLVLTFAPASLLGRAASQDNADNSKPAAQQAISPQVEEGSQVTTVAKMVMPAVVGVSTTKYEKDMFFGKTKVEGVGSGVIIDTKGYILTNNHVADMDSSSISVSLSDGRNVSARTVWTDADLDLSVLKIDAGNLTAAEIGNSDELQVGDLAVAIGNPMGLEFERSVTSGIISALNRFIPLNSNKFMEDLIQTDASINEGNSGGPLINSKGEVIGINTIKVKSAEGMGFAIPINVAAPIVKSFVESGDFKTPYLGISGLDRDIANFYDYKIDHGIYISAIDKTGPAYKAGMRKGYIITSINDTPVNTVTAMYQSIFSCGAGNKIKVKYIDDTGSEISTDVQLAEAPEGK